LKLFYLHHAARTVTYCEDKPPTPILTAPNAFAIICMHNNLTTCEKNQ